MNTLREMLASVCDENAARLAVVEGSTAVTYAELEQKIATRAVQLSQLEVRRGDRVALLLPNGLEFVISYFAIITVGAICVPLNDNYQQNELQYFLEVCDVSVLITSRDYASLCDQVIPRTCCDCRPFYVEDSANSADKVPGTLADFQEPIDPDGSVMFQFSSGSTGRPKKIGRTHRNVLFELDSFKKTLGVKSEDKFVGVAPFSHVNGLMRSMMASICTGATLYPLPRFDRQMVAETVEKNRITIFIAIPFIFSMLARSNYRRPPDFSSLRLCVSASAPMPQKLNHLFHEKFNIYVRQLYGSTETGTISVNLDQSVERSLESVGRPIAGVEVEVFAEDGTVAALKEMGEFAVKSPAAITAYDNLPEVNREVFKDGYFFTGDLGKRDIDGLLTLMGRKKFFINKGGYKINPREIEELLENHERVDEAVVLGVPTSYGDEKVKAVLVLNGPCTENELIDHCRGKIADFKIPSLIEFRESLPKSPTGKIRQKMSM